MTNSEQIRSLKEYADQLAIISEELFKIDFLGQDKPLTLIAMHLESNSEYLNSQYEKYKDDWQFSDVDFPI